MIEPLFTLISINLFDRRNQLFLKGSKSLWLNWRTLSTTTASVYINEDIILS